MGNKLSVSVWAVAEAVTIAAVLMNRFLMNQIARSFYLGGVLKG